MLIRAGQKKDIIPFKPFISCKTVCCNGCIGMTYMGNIIYIVYGCCNIKSLFMLRHLKIKSSQSGSEFYYNPIYRLLCQTFQHYLFAAIHFCCLALLHTVRTMMAVVNRGSGILPCGLVCKAAHKPAAYA